MKSYIANCMKYGVGFLSQIAEKNMFAPQEESIFVETRNPYPLSFA